jgi:hypothetical protein
MVQLSKLGVNFRGRSAMEIHPAQALLNQRAPKKNGRREMRSKLISMRRPA